MCHGPWPQETCLQPGSGPAHRPGIHQGKPQRKRGMDEFRGRGSQSTGGPGNGFLKHRVLHGLWIPGSILPERDTRTGRRKGIQQSQLAGQCPGLSSLHLSSLMVFKFKGFKLCGVQSPESQGIDTRGFDGWDEAQGL